MPRTPNFAYQDPTANIIQSLGRAAFSDPAAHAAMSAHQPASARPGGRHRRSVPRSAANLSGWLHEPYVKNAVIAVLKSAKMPLMLREVAEAAGFPISSASRVLYRLHRGGQVRRYRLPMQRPGYCHQRKAVTPGSATRRLFVYSLVRSIRTSGVDKPVR